MNYSKYGNHFELKTFKQHAISFEKRIDEFFLFFDEDSIGSKWYYIFCTMSFNGGKLYNSNILIELNLDTVKTFAKNCTSIINKAERCKQTQEYDEMFFKHQFCDKYFYELSEEFLSCDENLERMIKDNLSKSTPFETLLHILEPREDLMKCISSIKKNH